MEWFKDTKLSIFINWGYYGVNGIGESWSMYPKQISYEDNMAQGKAFTAKNYYSEAWDKLFKKIGARYAVLTTKHHDGVALWNTKYGKLNVKEKTSAKRDLVVPFVKALRQKSLKVGLHFSLTGFTSVLFVAALRIANALVWPAIWPLTLEGFGKFTKIASALLIMAISVGAIIPPLYERIVDAGKHELLANGIDKVEALSIAVTHGYWIFISCYAVILFFALKGHKHKNWTKINQEN